MLRPVAVYTLYIQLKFQNYGNLAVHELCTCNVAGEQIRGEQPYLIY